ncbi:MAG: Hpt domain-containing protein [Spirochaetaceae bacterium]|nr:Hpt domain-containing protein [Spirochaetaceae bacterium]
MILLSEVAERIRNEIRTWPSHRNLKVVIQIDPSLNETRDGDEGVFTEFLMMPIGLLPGSVSSIEIRIYGDNSKICIAFVFDSSSTLSKPLWRNLAEKTSVWNPQITIKDHGVNITLNLPVSADNPPVDLPAMALETGIRLDEAQIILKGFIVNSRTDIGILMDGIGKHGKESCFRAAHSIKGAGKTLRAPELAAAAGSLEKKIREDCETEEELRRLKSIWNRIEIWFEGE